MKLGVIAYATKTGLGYQTHAFYTHLKPTKTLVIDISEMNNEVQYRGMYSDAYFVKGVPTRDEYVRFLRGLDVVLLAETPLNYELYKQARRLGVKTVVQINPEFFDHLDNPSLPYPDVFINPSSWHEEQVKRIADANNVDYKQIHFPVDTNIFQYKQRNTKRIFHIAGKPAANDRNGTFDLLKVAPDATIMTQGDSLARHIQSRYKQSTVWQNLPNPASMYNFGDVMVLPRKYGGNCLPLNEALASGCPVIMPDISPNNSLLPKKWLVPAYKKGWFYAKTRVQLHEVDHVALKNKLKEVQQEWNIAQESLQAKQIADTISWSSLKQHYIEILSSN
jgi:glycosyltransferase involved in cell wall biosynthesis